mgnify:FL=1
MRFKRKSLTAFPYKFLACPFLLVHVIHFHPAIIHKDAYRWYVTTFGSLKDIDINPIYVEGMKCIYQGHQKVYFSMYKTGEKPNQEKINIQRLFCRVWG